MIKPVRYESQNLFALMGRGYLRQQLQYLEEAAKPSPELQKRLEELGLADSAS